jgi:hypothetical protein
MIRTKRVIHKFEVTQKVGQKTAVWSQRNTAMAVVFQRGVRDEYKADSSH